LQVRTGIDYKARICTILWPLKRTHSHRGYWGIVRQIKVTDV